MATHSSILAWEMTEGLEDYSPQGHKESGRTERWSTQHNAQ